VCIVVGAQRIRDAHDLGESFSGSWLQLHGFIGHVYGTIPVRAQSQASKEAYTALT
jgi:xanthosine utilization system XapX-like protein